MAITLRVRGAAATAGHVVEVVPRRVILGGYTGRDAEARDRHIDELRQIGIEPPAVVPAYWNVGSSLLTTDAHIQVQGERTSGEIEYALVAAGGRTYVGVASDQTDRELERHSIPRSKQLCPKVLGTDLVPIEVLLPRWDEAELASDVSEDGERWQPYQRSRLAAILRPDHLVTGACGAGGLADGDVLLSGTVPIVDGETRYLPYFRGWLRLEGTDVDLRLAYRIEMLSEDAAPRPADDGAVTR